MTKRLRGFGTGSLRSFSKKSPAGPRRSPTPPAMPSTTGALDSGYGAFQPR